MASRLKLHEELCNILGTRNVYFQPPESIKLQYPCIVYNLNRVETRHADNNVYKAERSYSVTLIHNNPDNEIIDKLIRFPMSRSDRVFQTQGLNHYVFTIYY